jgi:hypothetical protein
MHNCNLLTQYKTFYEYLDEHYEKVTLGQAKELMDLITKAWFIVERRKQGVLPKVTFKDVPHA